MTLESHAYDTRGTRDIALAFLWGVNRGWNYWAFWDWYLTHVRTPERMRDPQHAASLQVREPGVGTILLVDDFSRLPLRDELDTLARFHLAIVSAHTRVLGKLRRLAASQSIEFVQAALFAGRLRRGSGGPDRGAAWHVALDEADGLSDSVLALFAADYLCHPEEYLRGLCVCGVCGRVKFREGQLFRTLCPAHSTGWLTLNAIAARHRRVPPISGVFRKGEDPDETSTLEPADPLRAARGA